MNSECSCKFDTTKSEVPIRIDNCTDRDRKSVWMENVGVDAHVQLNSIISSFLRGVYGLNNKY